MPQPAARAPVRASDSRNSQVQQMPAWCPRRWRVALAGMALGIASGVAAAEAGAARTDGQLRGFLAGELSRAGVMVDARELSPHVYHLLIDRMVEPRDPDAAKALRNAARDTRFER